MTDFGERSEVARAMSTDIKHICKTYPNRYAGSTGEKGAAEYFEQKLTASADEVKTEPFNLEPEARYGWIPISLTAVLLGYVAYFFSTMITLLLLAVALIPLIFEYFLNNRMLDPLYKTETSQNISALKKCRSVAKRRLYIVADIDASRENCIKRSLGGIGLKIVCVLDFIGVGFYILISIVRWAIIGGLGAGIASGAMLYIGVGGIVFVVPLIMSYFMISKTITTDGANANLSGCMVATYVLQALKNKQFENTEVCVMLMGGSAVGLRGAKAWCDMQGDIVGENTAFLALHTLRETKGLRTYGGRGKKRSAIADIVFQSAKQNGLEIDEGRTAFVNTDSAEFLKRGFNSAELVALPKQLPEYYRTRYDTYDNIGQECLADCYELVLTILKNFAGEEPTVIASAEKCDETQQNECQQPRQTDILEDNNGNN